MKKIILLLILASSFTGELFSATENNTKKNSRFENPTYENYFIDAQVANGDFISQKLKARTISEEEFHLFSHGRSGELLINGAWKNAKEIANFLNSEFNIQNSTVSYLNIYGCEFAKGKKGKQAVAYLEKTLGVQVNASTNITGKDGDWILEVGNVKTNQFKNYQYNLQTCPAGPLVRGIAPDEDFDGDGICNRLDLDDDNDGILDEKEQENCEAVGIDNSNIQNSTASGTTSTTLSNGEVVTSSMVVSHPNLVATSSFDGYSSGVVRTRFSGSTNHGNTTDYFEVSYTFDKAIKVQLSYPGPAGTGNHGTTDVIQLIVSSGGFDINNPNNNSINVTENSATQVTFSPNSGGNDVELEPAKRGYTVTTSDAVTSVKLRFKNTDTGRNYVSIKISATCIEDTDNDGIPNHLDLDSDGDGCPDAIEGGGRFVNSQLVTDTNIDGGNTGGSFSGISGVSPVQTNLGTTVNANGIPTIVTGGTTSGTETTGQSVGGSQDKNSATTCTDTDGDGINDYVDLDDDNDGILDEKEQENCEAVGIDNSNIVNSTASGTTYTILSNGEVVTSSMVVSHPNLDATGSFDGYSSGVVRTRFSGPNQGNTTDYFEVSYTFDKAIKVQLSYPGSDAIGIHGTTDVFQLIVSSGGFDINNPNNNSINVTENSTTQVTFSPNSGGNDVELEPAKRGYTVTTSDAVTSVKLRFKNTDTIRNNMSIKISATCIEDKDNDGIPNHLDLDSDGDGCPDAIEGGGSFDADDLETSTISGGNTGGSFTGISGVSPVQTNLGTTVNTNGIPTIVTGGTTSGTETTGQSIGISQNKAIENCTDTDGDGIIDYVDLDDDNDGILDTDEGYCEAEAVKDIVFVLDQSGSINTTEATDMVNGIKAFLAGDIGSGRYISFVVMEDDNVYGEEQPALIKVAMTGTSVPAIITTYLDNWLAVANGAAVGRDYWASGFQGVIQHLGADLGPNYEVIVLSDGSSSSFVSTRTAAIPILNTGAHLFAIGPWPTVTALKALMDVTYGEPTQEVTDYATDYETSEFDFVPDFSGLGTVLSTQLEVAFCKVQDTDNDGIADHLDLDSDGDGCPDAIEGGGSFDADDLETSTIPGGNSGTNYNGLSNTGVQQNLGTTVDTNSSSSTYGVPIVSPATTAVTQAIGDSQTGSTDTECCKNASNYPAITDSDSDGIGDGCDLDDDNDGILDTDEGYCEAVKDIVFVLDQSGSISTAEATDMVNGIKTFLAGDIGSGRDISFVVMEDDNVYGEEQPALIKVAMTGTSVPASITTYLDNWLAVANGPSVGRGYWASGFQGVIQHLGAADLGPNYEVIVLTDGNSSSFTSTRIAAIPILNTGAHLFAIGPYDQASGATPTVGEFQAVMDATYGEPTQEVTDYATDYETSEFDFVPDFSGLGTVLSTQLGVTLCKVQDTDNDGIADYLDLDSDGDGCPDAIEGGGSFVNSQLVTDTNIDGGNTGGSFTGISGVSPVQTNLGTTVNANGIPTIVTGGTTSGTEITGQSIGISKNKAVESCTDTDGDGISDYVDLDDDNDGILDTDEGYCEAEAVKDIVFVLDQSGSITTTEATDMVNGIKAFLAGDIGSGRDISFVVMEDDNVYGEEQPALIKVAMTGTSVPASITTYLDNWLAVANGSSVGRDYWASGFQGVIRHLGADLGPNYEVIALTDGNSSSFTSTRIAAIPILNTGAHLFAIGPYDQAFGATPTVGEFQAVMDATYGEPTQEVTDYATDYETSEFDFVPDYSGLGTVLSTQLGVALCKVQDTDNDGIADYLDLDSDGDGCPDAIEGSAQFVNNNLIASSIPGGNTDGDSTYTGGNGPVVNNLGNTIDSNGVPTIANGGQYIGASQDENTATECDDTDGDGVNDYVDLDDDNDGILDVDENCVATSQAVHDGSIPFMSDGTTSGTSVTVSTQQTNANVSIVGNYSPPQSFVINGQQRVEYTSAVQINPDSTSNETVITYTFSNPISASEVGLMIEDFDRGSPVGIISVSGGTATTFNFSVQSILRNGVSSESPEINYNGATGEYSFPTAPSSSNRYASLISGNGTNTLTQLQLTVTDLGNSGGSGDNVRVFLVPIVDCNNDLDSDGISNSLDLDSDGDGCPDALEGDSAFVLSDLVASSMAGGNTDSTGFTGASGPVIGNLGIIVDSVSTSSTYGVPIVSPSDTAVTQGVGNAQDSLVATACGVPETIAENDSTATPEETLINIEILLNDSVQETEIDTATGITTINPTGNGTVVVNSNGTIDYTPNANFNGLDTITYILCDTTASPNTICDTALVFITVTAVNDTPVIVQPPVVVPEDSVIVICPTVTDPDMGDVLTVSTCSTPSNGTATSNDTCITYTPNAGFNGADSICIVVCDAAGLCDSVLVPITVTVVNDTPVIVQPPVVVPEDSVIVICPTVTDPDMGDVLTVSTCSTPSNGTATSNDTCITYTPNTNFNGADSICIVVCDAAGLCDSVLVPITISPVNDPPVAQDTTVSISENFPITICPVFTDIDGIGDSISSVTSCLPLSTNGGTVTISTNDSCVTYTPARDFVGTDRICYVVCDAGGLCDTASITIIVTPLTPDTLVTIDTIVCVDTTEIPGGVGTITLCDGSVTGPTSNGGSATVNPVTGCVTTTPDFGMSNTDTTCVIVCNTTTGGTVCDTTIIVTVQPPTTDTVTQLTNGMTTDSCISTSQLAGSMFTYTSCGSPNYGTLTNLDNCYKYVPSTNQLDTACTIICDEFGICDTTIFIYVPPVTPDTIVTIDTVVCVDTTQVPGGVGTITTCDGGTTTSNGGTVSIDANGCVTTTPNFGSGNTDTTCIVVCNTIAGVTICDTTIIVTVQPPTTDTVTQLTNGMTTDSCISTNQLVGTNLTYTSCGNPAYGTLTNIDSCYRYVSSTNQLDTACTIICDEFGICDTTIFIYVPPVTPDTIVTIDTVVCVDTTQVPGGVGTITTCDGGTTTSNGGTVSIDANGCVTVSPDFTSGNTDTTCIVICDTALGICDTTIIVTVQPPTTDTVTQLTNGMTTDSCISTSQLAGSMFTYTSCGSPNYGTLTNLDNCYKYVPSTNQLDTACTIICDEFGICDTTIFIYVPPVTTDTIVTIDTNVCLDTTQLPGNMDTIYGCDGLPLTSTSNGGTVSVDAQGCVTISPTFTTSNTDTTCIVICDTALGICDTTIIVTVQPPTTDTVTQLTNGMTTDSCISTSQLAGSMFTYTSCGSPNYGTLTNLDNCYKYVPSTNQLDTACTIICDEFGICDTTIFIYVPPVTPDTIVTIDTVVCVDTTQVPGGVGTITTCDGGTTTSNGGTVSIDANGCVTTTPNFGSGNTDTTCIVVCNTIAGVTICDTTIIVTVQPPTTDTVTQLTNGMTTDSCISTNQLVGTNLTYTSCGNPAYGTLTNIDSCYRYVSSTNQLDTACTIICDEFGICDTTIFIYVPPVTPDTIVTIDTVVCVDTTQVPGGVGTITTCDGGTTTSNGGTVSIDANGCVTVSPDFTSGNTDTTCIVICNTVGGLQVCDTTIIVTVQPPTIDTVVQLTNGMTTDSCISTDQLVGTNLTYTSCGAPNYGTLTNLDSCYKYVPSTNQLDTACTIICDEFGICDTTIFIYVPPVTTDTIVTIDTNVCLDTTQLPGNMDTIYGCDGLPLTSTSNGGTVSVDAQGCVTISPTFTTSNTDTTCIVICDTALGICDTTIIVTVQPPTTDTVTQLTNGMTTDSCISTSQLAGSMFTYTSCGSPNYGTLTNLDNCYKYVPSTNQLDTACTIICDEFGICDTTIFIYVPPVTPDTIVTIDTVVCVDTTQVPGGVGTITTCDGGTTTSNGGTVSIDANGCVTTTPNFGSGNTDTTCIVVCNTIAGVTICDTTIIVTVQPPTTDTVTQLTNGMTTDSCISTNQLVGTNLTYTSCGNPAYGTLTNIDSCYRYVSSTNQLDTACTIICDEFGICDTTIFIYVPPVTPDTIVTIDTVVCVDTTQVPGGVGTITTCDGGTTTSNGGTVSIDANGCVTVSPDFTSGNTDTTCIVICNTVGGLQVCDTTIIVTVQPPTIDTVVQLTNGMTTDSCISTDQLVGTNLTYTSCGAPNYGTLTNLDSCYKYVPSTNQLDTACTIICDEFGICDTTIFIYVPPVTPDTIVTIDTVVCVDTTQVPGGVGTITTCDGGTTTSNGGTVSIDANGCVTTTPNFGSGNTDTTCIVVCNTIAGVTICDTTIIVTVKRPTPDTIIQLTNGLPVDTCIGQPELLGKNLTYYNCGNPRFGVRTTNQDTCFNYIPILNRLDKSCVVVCDEYGICDTTYFIYVPPVTVDTIYTQDTLVCVDTTEMSDGYDIATGCDGNNPTTTSGGGMVTVDTKGCVSITPQFNGGKTDTTCIVICDTIFGQCDTTIIISMRKTVPDTIYQCVPRDGEANDSAMNTNDLLGPVVTTSTFKLAKHGQFFLTNDTNSSYQTLPFPVLDTVQVSFCDKYNFCDTFTFIYIPPMNVDTLYTRGAGVICVDTTEMPDGRYTSIGTCDGMGMTTNGGAAVMQAGGCVMITPDFSASIVDTTCIVICDSILPMCECDTTYVISFKPTTPDTFAILLPKGSNTADTCLTTHELFGSTYTYRRLGGPTPHGPVTTHNDTCINYVQTSTTKYLDTARILICDEFGNCDTTIIIYVPTPDPDTLYVGPVVPLTNADTCVTLESTYMTGMYINTCDSTGTSSGGVGVTITGLCVRYPVPAPVFTGDTVCIIVCDTILNVTICDTTMIVYLPDTTPPTVVCKNDTVYLNGLGTAMIDTSNVVDTVYDNTLINAVWVTPTMFNCINVGPNTVTLYARDTNRNMDSCFATITVLDTLSPIVVCRNITVQLDTNGDVSITAAQIDGGSTDNCAIASLTIDKTSFDCSNLGANTVTLTVIDVNGNVSTCTSTVTVEDNISPITYCPGDKQRVVRNTTCEYIVEDFTGEASAWDNCSVNGVIITQSPAAGTPIVLNNRDTTITITATDASGNISTCTFTVYARCVMELNIPQFFSPNGDGTNDTWELPELANYPDNTVKVFNRWGNLVFEQKGYYTGWNGSANVNRGANRLMDNKVLPDGTYYYIIDLGNGQEPYVGYLQIKR